MIDKRPALIVRCGGVADVALLRFLRLSPSRFHTWRRLQDACALDDQNVIPLALSHAIATVVILQAFDEAVTGRLHVGIAYLR